MKLEQQKDRNTTIKFKKISARTAETATTIASIVESSGFVLGGFFGMLKLATIGSAVPAFGTVAIAGILARYIGEISKKVLYKKANSLAEEIYFLGEDFSLAYDFDVTQVELPLSIKSVARLFRD